MQDRDGQVTDATYQFGVSVSKVVWSKSRADGVVELADNRSNSCLSSYCSYGAPSFDIWRLRDWE